MVCRKCSSPASASACSAAAFLVSVRSCSCSLSILGELGLKAIDCLGGRDRGRLQIFQCSRPVGKLGQGPRRLRLGLCEPDERGFQGAFQVALISACLSASSSDSVGLGGASPSNSVCSTASCASEIANGFLDLRELGGQPGPLVRQVLDRGFLRACQTEFFAGGGHILKECVENWLLRALLCRIMGSGRRFRG